MQRREAIKMMGVGATALATGSIPTLAKESPQRKIQYEFPIDDLRKWVVKYNPHVVEVHVWNKQRCFFPKYRFFPELAQTAEMKHCGSDAILHILDNEYSNYQCLSQGQIPKVRNNLNISFNQALTGFYPTSINGSVWHPLMHNGIFKENWSLHIAPTHEGLSWKDVAS